MPESYLRVAGDEGALFRERAVEVVQKAFEHFRKKMDTSPHRQALSILSNNIEKTTAIKVELDKQVVEARDEQVRYEAARKEQEGIRVAWQQMRSSHYFTSAELEAPSQTEIRLTHDKDKLAGEIEMLGRNISRIGSAQESLRKFRRKYPGRSPLEVEAELHEQLKASKLCLERIQNTLESVKHEKCKCELERELAQIHRERAEYHQKRYGRADSADHAKAIRDVQISLEAKFVGESALGLAPGRNGNGHNRLHDLARELPQPGRSKAHHQDSPAEKRGKQNPDLGLAIGEQQTGSLPHPAQGREAKTGWEMQGQAAIKLER